jgi:hypothetical protein
MPNESSANDPKTIWQSQPTEPSKMTLVMIRHKTQQLHAQTRRDRFAEIAASVIMIGFYGCGIWWIHAAALRAIFALAIAWTLAGQSFVDRRSLSDASQLEVPLSTSLESYRREVERRRDLSSRFLLWSFGPGILALGAFCAYLLAWTHGFVRSTAPFFTLLGLWFVLLFFQKMRQKRDLQREIDQLNEVERSNNS